MLRSKSVDELLDVLRVFKRRYDNGDSVSEAFTLAKRSVAGERPTDITTTHDLCTRRLKLKGIDGFRSLLQDWVAGNPSSLIDVLKNNTNIYNHNKIIAFFTQGKTSLPKQKAETAGQEVFSFRLKNDVAKKLHILFTAEEVSTNWMAEIVSKSVNQRYDEWLNKQKPDPVVIIPPVPTPPSGTNTKRPRGRKGHEQFRDYLIPVIKLIKSGMKHTDAFKQRAKELNVERSTVSAECATRLNISTYKFAELVESNKIKSFLKERFPDKASLIEQEL